MKNYFSRLGLPLCSLLLAWIGWVAASPVQGQIIGVPGDPRTQNVVTVAVLDAEGAEPERLPPGVMRPTVLNPVVFIFTRQGAIDFDLPVFYRLGGTARNGVDYDKLPGVITIPAGAAAVRMVVIPLDDDLAEPTENVVVTVEYPLCVPIVPPPRECYLVGPTLAARGLILDNGAVPGNSPPKVALTKPLPGQSFSEPATINLEAQTADADGYADFVEFFANGAKVGESRLVFIRPPDPGTILTHTFDWVGVKAGAYELVAVARDDRGASTKSPPVLIKVVSVDPEPPVVSVLATDAIATEPRTPLPNERLMIDRGVFTISRKGGLDQELKVHFELAGTASNGADYQTLVSPAVIPAGVESAVVEVFPINDRRIERTEVVTLSLVPNSAYTLGRPVVASVELFDNGETDPIQLPVVNVQVLDGEAMEPPTNDPNVRIKVDDASFLITRSGPVDAALGVRFRVGGTASNGTDYQTLNQIAVIAPGERSATVSVVPLFDRLPEVDESVIVQLVPWPLVPLPLDPVTGTVVEGDLVLPPDDLPVRLGEYVVGPDSIAKVVIHDNGIVTENRPPKADIVRPLRGQTYDAPALVEIEVQTADADGYVPFVEFFANGRKIGESQITFVKAPEPGTLISHFLKWENVPAGEYALTAIAHDDGGQLTTTAAVGIQVTPLIKRTIVSVKATDAEGAEPNPVPPGMGLPIRLDPVTFTVTRDGDLTGPLVVYYHLEGTARNGVDYGHLAGKLEIPAGKISAEVMVTPIDDSAEEGTETVVIVIDPPVCLAVAKPMPGCYVVGAEGSARGTILDNDPNASRVPIISVVACDAVATEGRNDWATSTATFVLRRQGPTNGEVKVALKLGGTATPGKDYAPFADRVVIPAGVSNVRLVVTPLNDDEVERIETVTVEVLPSAVLDPEHPIDQAGSTYGVGRPSRAVAMIIDNDQPRPGCRRLPDGLFHLCLPGDPGVSYRLEASRDLLNWADAGLVTGSDGAVHYVDPNSSDAEYQFYRLQPLPLDSAEALP